MTNKNLHIRYKDSNITHCGLEIKYVQCRPRYGHCNLESGHKSKHNANIDLLDGLVVLADDNDEDSVICSICLVDSF